MKKFYLPPLYDHHSHFLLYAALSSMPSLAGVRDRGAALDIIRKSESPGITIIQGWNSSAFNLSPEDLGDERPVIVLNLSLHGMVMNSGAKKALTPGYSDIADNHNNLLWVEQNLPRILKMIPCVAEPSHEKISSFGSFLMDAGIGALDDMLLPDGKWIDMISSAPIPVTFRADEELFDKLTPGEKGKLRGVKIFADGALGTCTAAISQPYTAGGNGILLMEVDLLNEKLHKYMCGGVPLAVHAIGDRAVARVVQAVGRLRSENGCGGEVRIEHAQFITRDSAFAAREAGITLSMQPNFSSDSVIYAERLPRGFAAINNPFRMLIDSAGFVPGKDLLFGSDGMPHGLRPALQDALFPPFPGQVLSVTEFISGYCMEGEDNMWEVEVDEACVNVRALKSHA